MTTFNVVRFRIKPGREDEFLDAHRQGKARWPGLEKGHIIKTGDNSYCLIGEWADLATLKGARDQMIATLNSFRDTPRGPRRRPRRHRRGIRRRRRRPSRLTRGRQYSLFAQG